MTVDREPYVYQVLRSMAERRGERLTGWVKELIAPYQCGREGASQGVICHTEKQDDYKWGE